MLMQVSVRHRAGEPFDPVVTRATVQVVIPAVGADQMDLSAAASFPREGPRRGRRSTRRRRDRRDRRAGEQPH
jgi:hypothetical protein